MGWRIVVVNQPDKYCKTWPYSLDTDFACEKFWVVGHCPNGGECTMHTYGLAPTSYQVKCCGSMLVKIHWLVIVGDFVKYSGYSYYNSWCGSIKIWRPGPHTFRLQWVWDIKNYPLSLACYYVQFGVSAATSPPIDESSTDKCAPRDPKFYNF